jgi:hypothetical protein
VAKIASLPAIEVTGNLLWPHGFAKTDTNIRGSIKAAITVTGTDSLGTAITLDAADYSVEVPALLSAGENATATLRVSGSNTSTGSDITQRFEVYIKNDAKEITEFYFTIGGKHYGVKTNAEAGSGIMSGNAITITVPYGENRNELTPFITVSPKASSFPATEAAQDFTASSVTPVTYKVTAEDETTADYTVTVQEDTGLTIDTITVETLGNFTFSLSSVTTAPDGSITAAPNVEITITLKDTNNATVTGSNWYIAISGPGAITPTGNKFKPTVRGFYNINVFATRNGIPYSGSFGLTVE